MSLPNGIEINGYFQRLSLKDINGVDDARIEDEDDYILSILYTNNLSDVF